MRLVTSPPLNNDSPRRRLRPLRLIILLAVIAVAASFAAKIFKLSEDRVIYQGVLPASGQTSFEVMVNGSEFPTQTVRIDVQGVNQPCEIELENPGPETLTSDVPFKGSPGDRHEMKTLAAGERARVYEGPSQVACFGLYDPPHRKLRLKIHVTVKDAQPPAEHPITARVLWADGP